MRFFSAILFAFMLVYAPFAVAVGALGKGSGCASGSRDEGAELLDLRTLSASWAALSPKLFSPTDFMVDKECYANERTFLGCIHQMEAALSFFPGFKVVPPPGDSRYASAPVVATFREARVVDARFLAGIGLKEGRPGLLRETRKRLHSWLEVYRDWKPGERYPVTFFKFANWLARSPSYHVRRTEVGAAMLNAKLRIELDAHSHFAPRAYHRSLVTPKRTMGGEGTEDGFVVSTRAGKEGKVAWMQIRSFGDIGGALSPSGEFKRELQRHIDEGATSVLLDLRGNKGGSVDEAGKIANLFIRPGKNRFLIRLNHFSGRPANYPLRLEAASFADIPLVILVDAESASSSELLAGALQDYGRAIVVGDFTYGKGTGQDAQVRDDFSQLVFLGTSALGELPSGTTPYRTGIYPDILNAAWGVETWYRSPPEREQDLEMVDPIYPIPFPSRRLPPPVDKAFEEALRQRRANVDERADENDLEVRLAVDVLACWHARTRAPAVAPSND